MRPLNTEESVTLLLAGFALAVCAVGALGGMVWAAPFTGIVLGGVAFFAFWNGENRPGAILALVVALALAFGVHHSATTDRDAAARHAEAASENARLHAERAERVRSGECHLVGPGQATHSTGGKYPKLFFTDFVVYECKNGDVFRMPLP